MMLICNGRGQYAQAWRLFCRTRINRLLAIPEAGNTTFINYISITLDYPTISIYFK
jgi:hypothetical protein